MDMSGMNMNGHIVCGAMAIYMVYTTFGLIKDYLMGLVMDTKHVVEKFNYKVLKKTWTMNGLYTVLASAEAFLEDEAKLWRVDQLNFKFCWGRLSMNCGAILKARMRPSLFRHLNQTQNNLVPMKSMWFWTSYHWTTLCIWVEYPLSVKFEDGVMKNTHTENLKASCYRNAPRGTKLYEMRVYKHGAEQELEINALFELDRDWFWTRPTLWSPMQHWSGLASTSRVICLTGSPYCSEESSRKEETRRRFREAMDISVENVRVAKPRAQVRDLEPLMWKRHLAAYNDYVHNPVTLWRTLWNSSPTTCIEGQLDTGVQFWIQRILSMKGGKLHNNGLWLQRSWLDYILYEPDLKIYGSLIRLCY